MDEQRYLIALGSNMRHARHGAPALVLRAAFKVLNSAGLTIEAASPIIATAPLGPSRRYYANAAVIVRTHLIPDALLTRLKSIERSFGDRRRGQRWRARMLDLDIVLWNGGAFASMGLTVPHTAFRQRVFVLGPASRIAANWRDSHTHLTVRHLHARLTRPRPARR